MPNKINKTLLRWLDFVWYKDHFVAVWLTPFSMVYQDIIRLRRFLYRCGVFKTRSVAVPVIVVGNISVGGTGKTPLLIFLVELLKQKGYQPGIISRGYGGVAEHWPQWVDASSNPQLVGDEALLIAKQTSCPVAVAPKRIEAAQLILEKTACNIILSDDGLQHYALHRDIEIAVIDGVRRFGTGFFLPAGPLREPISRLQEVDFVVCNGGVAEAKEYSMQVDGSVAINLVTGEERQLNGFIGELCHALAGIGNPQRFFMMLEKSGLDIKQHRFPDHYGFQQSDIEFNDNKPVLMTEKDAVKCTGFASERHWYVPVKTTVKEDFAEQFLTLLQAV